MPDGKMHRSNLLVASADVLSADLVGAAILGYMPEKVPHIMHAADNHGRPWDFSDIEVVGESIDADPGLFENVEATYGFYMGRYKDKPEFDEAFFQVE